VKIKTIAALIARLVFCCYRALAKVTLLTLAFNKKDRINYVDTYIATRENKNHSRAHRQPGFFCYRALAKVTLLTLDACV